MVGKSRFQLVDHQEEIPLFPDGFIFRGQAYRLDGLPLSHNVFCLLEEGDGRRNFRPLTFLFGLGQKLIQDGYGLGPHLNFPDIALGIDGKGGGGVTQAVALGYPGVAV